MKGTRRKKGKSLCSGTEQSTGFARLTDVVAWFLERGERDSDRERGDGLLQSP